jgi:hypothetical protein
MSQLNANCPYIKCYLRKEFTSLDTDIEGFLFGVKSMINHPLLFHFQSSFGAVFWNIPISFLTHEEKYDRLSTNEETRLQLLETWDSQSTAISTICFKFLENKNVEVFCRDKKYRKGTYIFTIDDYDTDPNTINVGYSQDLDSKCFHFIKLNDGNFCIQPNNLLRWHNADFIVPYSTPPKINTFKERLSSEAIDRSYGNSPYYFYNHDTQKKKSDGKKCKSN